MEFQLLNAADEIQKTRWLTLLEELPVNRNDVYFRPEYLQAYANSVDVEACCAVCKSDSALFIYPFLKSSLAHNENFSDAEGLQDIQSAYGYGGPVVNSSGEDPQLLEEAWRLFSEWRTSEQVVSEFVRFHPLLDNVRWASPSMKTFKDRLTIPIKLESYESEMLGTSYYRAHRQMVNKAGRMGFSFHVLPVNSELSWFVPLYQQTQEFLQAGSETRFGMDYFKTLADGLGKDAWLGVIKQADEIAGAVMVLESSAYLHSHLMGYRRDIKTSGMTNLLYHGIALEGASRRKSILHMGGGLTSSDEDRLLRFKKSLSPAREFFWLGTHCHDQAQYEKLGQEWESKNGPRPKNYLQFYHLPGSA